MQTHHPFQQLSLFEQAAPSPPLQDEHLRCNSKWIASLEGESVFPEESKNAAYQIVALLLACVHKPAIDGSTSKEIIHVK